ncbi:MAG: bifunctional diaminohydroxyphosphoribosylaminopyrimidine deaminase/5-amino-6-(5-phosphoribosylamino)uracil reductase RibD [Actinomycetota bacterium]|nr:bifunctional diaminohydroxyphosphoribosylaminopyrimidine deaminase/5-amino-6-(5-phosphoribosylamino)uracil reductase RibD [Actinomycetota bacterium]
MNVSKTSTNTEYMNQDERFMLRAIELAELGRGFTHPNPLVGAVLVKDGVAVGEGYHLAPGKPHAEVVAIENAGKSSRDSILYVTLEPCSHHGRTPPCTESIISAGISEVVYSIKDPNPDVSGNGAEVLRQNGIRVREGVLRSLTEKQNQEYLKKVTTGLPFVTLKMAVSIDGKVSRERGNKTVVSSWESMEQVHRMRSVVDAIVVGIGTVLSDNPLLTVRMGVGKRRVPVRIVLDSNARTPIGSNIADTKDVPTIVVAAESAPAERVKRLRERGVEVIEGCGMKRVDLHSLLRILGKRQMTSVLVEGGPKVAYSFLKENLIDRMVLFVAPVAFVNGPALLEGSFQGFELERFVFDSVDFVGPDLRIVAYPEGNYCGHEGNSFALRQRSIAPDILV